ncbi:MAG: carbohydrate-binding domain-containing protein, partial [Cyanobacteria bacterium J06648_11]
LDYAATGTGTTDITVRASDTGELSVETTFNVTVADDNPPPTGSSVRIQAEDYRSGTSGVEYFDSTAGNKGDANGFTDDVDVSVTTDVDGEFHLSFIANGEFLTYDLNLPEAGQYDIVARVATSRSSARKANLSIGNTQIATLSFGSTGGFSTWEDVVIEDVTLPAGPQTLRVDVLKGAFNFNYLDIVPAGSAPSNTAPTTTGIADIAVVEGTDSSVVELFDAFDDAQSPDSELVYAIANNTNGALFETLAIDDATGQLTLNFATGSTGSAELTISATDPEGLSVETTFTATVTGQPGNTAPTSSGIGDVVDVTGGGDRIIDLRSRFSDDQPTDQLQFEVTANSNPGLFDSIAVNPLTGALTLDYGASPGSAALTVRGTDAEGEFVETSFVATSVNPQPTNGAIRINAGGGETYDPAGNFWQADSFFTGGQTFD